MNVSDTRYFQDARYKNVIFYKKNITQYYNCVARYICVEVKHELRVKIYEFKSAS